MTSIDVAQYRVGRCCDEPVYKPTVDEFQSFVTCRNCECRCVNPGQDDGQITCWTHHDCSWGDCTHGDN